MLLFMSLIFCLSQTIDRKYSLFQTTCSIKYERAHHIVEMPEMIHFHCAANSFWAAIWILCNMQAIKLQCIIIVSIDFLLNSFHFQNSLIPNSISTYDRNVLCFCRECGFDAASKWIPQIETQYPSNDSANSRPSFILMRTSNRSLRFIFTAK